MNYVGIDYHQKYSHATAVDEEGRIIASRRVANEVDDFRGFFANLEGPVKATLEATRTWGVLFDILDGLDGVDEVVLAHPAKVRMIAEAKVKTDKIDAGHLAQLLRADLIPAAYIPPKRTRQGKTILRQRMFLVRLRTMVKNRIQVLLDRLHLPKPAVTDLFGKAGTNYLRKLLIDGPDGKLLSEDLELLELLNRLIRETEGEIRIFLAEDQRITLARTIPGLGEILAALVTLEIDAIDRFASPKKLAAYAGLVPSTFSSGGKTYHGRLIKMSNKWLRWAFVEAAWVSIRVSPYCRFYYERCKSRKGASTAVVALARRLAEITWHILKEQRPYEERPLSRQNRFIQRNPDPAALART